MRATGSTQAVASPGNRAAPARTRKLRKTTPAVANGRGIREIVAYLAAPYYVDLFSEWRQPLDHTALTILGPLAIALLVSGLDDLLVDAVWLWIWLKSRLWRSASLYPPGPRQLETAPRLRIAVVSPLWHGAGGPA